MSAAGPGYLDTTMDGLGHTEVEAERVWDAPTIAATTAVRTANESSCLKGSRAGFQTAIKEGPRP